MRASGCGSRHHHRGRKEISRGVLLPLGDKADNGRARLAKVGLRVVPMGDELQVMQVQFGSRAEKLGIEQGFTIKTIENDADRPAKEWMMVPAPAVAGPGVLGAAAPARQRAAAGAGLSRATGRPVFGSVLGLQPSIDCRRQLLNQEQSDTGSAPRAGPRPGGLGRAGPRLSAVAGQVDAGFGAADALDQPHALQHLRKLRHRARLQLGQQGPSGRWCRAARPRQARPAGWRSRRGPGCLHQHAHPGADAVRLRLGLQRTVQPTMTCACSNLRMRLVTVARETPSLCARSATLMRASARSRDDQLLVRLSMVTKC